ncbi:MAG: HlyC/CorC family transporter [Gammaproteobacteria bacterium]|nr:HlyC/CorC family transporter [Gammaproteobacteria bacterium]
MDILILVLLIVINGLFAMSEMAVVSSRKARLQRLIDEGNHHGALAALKLHDSPSSFLSTVQVGITLIGILSGAIGENALIDPLSHWLTSFPVLENYSRMIALTIVVMGLTYFTVVVGELVPKRIGLLAPEKIAARISIPMNVLTKAVHPLVVVLSSSSSFLMKLIGAHSKDEPPVTDEEIKVLMGQGAEAGIFHHSEQQIVSNVLRLDDQRATAIMTPRVDLYYIDLEDGEDEIKNGIVDSVYSRIVVCAGGLENIVGILELSNLLKASFQGNALQVADIEAVLTPPLYIPENVTTTQLLENFRRSQQNLALLVDEYGELQGIVTIADVFSSIVGDLTALPEIEEQDAVRREDGSWLMDSSIYIERLKALLDIQEGLPGEEKNYYHTLSGFVMHVLGRIPRVSDHFNCAGYRFEVLDMDKHRIDKVLVASLDLKNYQSK